MRTTVNIDEHLLRAAKQAALSRNEPLGSVLEDALRLLLAQRAEPDRPTVDLPTYGGSGLQPGVDLEDKGALAVLLGDDASAHAAR